MRRAAFSFLVLALAACTHASSNDATGHAPTTEGPTTPSTPAAASHARGTPIATLSTRDARVTILGRGSTDRDLRVVVRKGDAIVADGISIDELRSADPTLHALVTNALASGKDGTWIDATLDLPSAHDLDPATSAGAGPAVGRHLR